jgi:hypothetical protein
LKFHVIRASYSGLELATLLDTVHQAMVQSFQVSPRDRYQILNEHPREHLIALDTGLGFERTSKFVLIEIVSRQRTREQKLAFYEAACRGLRETCGLGPKDLMMTFQINGDEDWSFGDGVAQFVTGDL